MSRTSTPMPKATVATTTIRSAPRKASSTSRRSSGAIPAWKARASAPSRAASASHSLRDRT